MGNADAIANLRSSRTVETVRGQYHKFMPIPVIERHARWFGAGPVAIAVEARALGNNEHNIVRGPSIHVFNAARTEEYLRFDLFGKVLHYHYILNDLQHNILWGYDPTASGPMLAWTIAALRDRLPSMLRHAHAPALAAEVEESGWDRSVLAAIETAAAEALGPRDDDFVRAREGMAWMQRWKEVHPQFNTVED